MVPITYQEPGFYGMRETEFSTLLAGSMHELCLGHFSLHPESKTHNRIICNRCGLAVTFPNTVVTFGDLRLHLKDFNPPPRTPQPTTTKTENEDGEVSRRRTDTEEGND
jgi:hypothetical protein